MGRKEKLIERLKSNPKDFTFDELQTVLESLGFEMTHRGKTGGSRVKFMKGNIAISLHKPHPRKELLAYQVNQILEILEKGHVI